MPQLAPVQISIINASSVLGNEEILPIVSALQQQVTRDFRPAWGIDAKLTFFATGAQPPAGTWWLTILDDSDQAGALGYHDLTPDGLPIGKVFAGTDLKLGNSWSVTASHELLEMLADPNINLSVLVQENQQTAGLLYAYEICDACESDNLGYQVEGVTLSDFVYPTWFEGFRAAGSIQFDQTNQINTPFQLLAGGYIGVFDITAGTGWHQVTAEKHPTSASSRASVGTRRERRRVPRSQLLTSRPHNEIMKRMHDYIQRIGRIDSRRVAA